MIANTGSSYQPRRVSPTLAALVVGLPMTAGLLAFIHFSPLQQTVVARYVSHPAQWAAVALFCCALGALGVKYLASLKEGRACQFDLLPRWDGVALPLAEAPTLLAAVQRLPARVQGTGVVRRIGALLEFLCQRRTAVDLDDQIRFLADNDSLAQENSFALIRFLTWAMPIVGFLGTVLGITSAIAGVTPETLGDSLGQVTGGLAEAFDSTALALALTMLAMFLTFLVEKHEQGVLERIDAFIDRQLTHRFQREGQAEGPFAAAVQQNTQALMRVVEGLVVRQAELWSQAMATPERRVAELHARLQEQLIAGLGSALERSVQQHAQRLGEMERQGAERAGQLLQQVAGVATALREAGQQQQQSLARVAESVSEQAAVLGGLQQEATNLVHLQAVLHQNLAALAGAGTFEQAVHTLTAAIHLLTARAAGAPPAAVPEPRHPRLAA